MRTTIGITGGGPAGLLLARLRRITASRPAAAELAANYTGLPLPI